jgi:formylglycine-generating enzyme required for sulfatase activity
MYRLFIISLLLLTLGIAHAQDVKEFESKILPKPAPAKEKTTRPVPPKATVYKVKFMPDMICSLYVNNEFKSLVDPAKGYEVRTTAAQNRIKVKVVNLAGDQLDTSFQAENDREFHIQLKYKKERREMIERKMLGEPVNTESTGNKAVKPEPEKKAVIKSDVSFVSDADCILIINDSLRIEMTRGKTEIVTLPAGGYRINAQNKRTRRVLTKELKIDNAKPFTEQFNFGDAEEPAAVVETDPQKLTARDIQKNMVMISGGSYMMGNDFVAKVEKVKDEGPEHTVKIKPIYFGMYEVTQAQWQAIMGSNPSSKSDCPTCPVENVSWEDIQAFIAKLNTISGKKFRLPTEAEWEFVAKKGLKEDFENEGSKKDFLHNLTWCSYNSGKKTHPVGQKKANASGVYDLFGNVAEWCQDWYDAGYYKENVRDNPAGPKSGKERVVRGGAFDINEVDFRPSIRDSKKPGYKSKELGFRLVLDSEN